MTDDGATDPGPEDTGDEVDRSVAVVPDKFNQLLGGDNFGPDRDDNVHTGNVGVPTGRSLEAASPTRDPTTTKRCRRRGLSRIPSIAARR